MGTCGNGTDRPASHRLAQRTARRRTGSRPSLPSCRSSPRQPSLFHSPLRHFYTILTEERFAFEDQCRHTPMAGLFKRILIVGYFRVECFGLILYFGLDFPRIQAGTFQSAGKVVSLVPVRLSAPDQLSCLVG